VIRIWHRFFKATRLNWWAWQFSLNPRLQSWCDEGKHLQHLLRESWRFTHFENWKQSNRRDAAGCEEVSYGPARIRLLHKHQFTSYEFGVLCGAAVSPARYHVMLRGHSDQILQGCPCCGLPAAEASWKHVAWTCPSIIFPPDIYLIHRHDILNMRLGWPSQSKGLETVKWLAMVRAKTRRTVAPPASSVSPPEGGAEHLRQWTPSLLRSLSLSITKCNVLP